MKEKNKTIKATIEDANREKEEVLKQKEEDQIKNIKNMMMKDQIQQLFQ